MRINNFTLLFSLYPFRQEFPSNFFYLVYFDKENEVEKKEEKKKK
jgi:hypothetical protein